MRFSVDYWTSPYPHWVDNFFFNYTITSNPWKAHGWPFAEYQQLLHTILEDKCMHVFINSCDKRYLKKPPKKQKKNRTLKQNCCAFLISIMWRSVCVCAHTRARACAIKGFLALRLCLRLWFKLEISFFVFCISGKSHFPQWNTESTILLLSVLGERKASGEVGRY